MHLIEIFLPRYDNDRQLFGREAFDGVRDELMQRFGGVTIFSRAPVEGLWKDDGGSVSRDEIIIFEVMAENLDCLWWAEYRKKLEQTFS